MKENDNIHISDQPPDKQKTQRQKAVGPRFYKTRSPYADDEDIDLYHADAVQISTDQLRESSDEGPLAAAFVSLALLFGKGGLYNSLTPDQADEIAADLTSAAATIRKVLEEEGIDAEQSVG